MAFIQYPWRFLALATFFISFLSGTYLKIFQKQKKFFSPLLALVLIAGLFYLNLKYFKVKTNFAVTASDYYEEKNIKWVASKISDEYLPKDFPTPQSQSEAAWDKLELIKGQAEIKNMVLTPHQYSFVVSTLNDSEILVNLAYFPGWKLWVNGKETLPTLDSGKIKLSLSSGSYKILLKFTNTPIRTLANFVSFISLFSLLFLILRRKKI